MSQDTYPFMNTEWWEDPSGDRFQVLRATQAIAAFVDGVKINLTPGTTYLANGNMPNSFFSFNETTYRAAGCKPVARHSVFHASEYDEDLARAVAALNAAPSGTLQLTGGRIYSVPSVLSISANSLVAGNGATIQYTGSTDKPISIAGSNVTIKDLTVDTSQAAVAPTAIVFTSAGGLDNISCRRVNIVSPVLTGAGFRFANASNSELIKCKVSGTANAFNLTGGSHNKIINCLGVGTLAGVLLNPYGAVPVTHTDVVGTTIKDWPANAVLGYGIRSAGISSTHNSDIRYMYCTVIGVQGRGYIDGSTPGGTADQINAVYTDGLTVVGCHSKYSGDYGFSATNCTKIEYSACYAHENTTGGFVASNNCSGATYTGCTAMNNGQNWDNHAPQATYRYGIGSGGASNWSAVGCIVGDDQTVKTQDYGIRIQYGGDNYTIGPNIYITPKTANLYHDGTSTNIRNFDTATLP